MDDIGLGIAEAAINGFRLGKQREQDEILRSWQEYATGLEQRIERLQEMLANSQVEVDRESFLRIRAQDLLTNACNERDNLEKELAEIKNKATNDWSRLQLAIRSLSNNRDALEQELVNKEKGLSAIMLEHEKYRALIGAELQETCTKLQETENSLRSSSAKAAGLEGILRMLKAEIAAIDDPARYNSLRVDVMLKEMGKYW